MRKRYWRHGKTPKWKHIFSAVKIWVDSPRRTSETEITQRGMR
jgi:hypothetical protein